LFESGDAAAQIYFADVDSTSVTSVGIGALGDDLRLIASAGGGVRVTVQGSDGAMGIGETNPKRRLHIDSGNTGTQIRLTGNSFAGMEFDSDSDDVAEAAFSTDANGNFTFRAGGNSSVNDKFRLMAAGGFFFKEQSAADANQTTFGQLWVKDTNPVQLWFTDDLGNDTQIV
jgi:hypothetical protein